MVKVLNRVEVHANYRDEKPTVDVKSTVQSLIDDVPPELLVGFERVVLKCAADRPRGDKRRRKWSRGRKVHEGEVRALYHPQTAGQTAWIELFVDRLLNNVPRVVQWLPFVRDIVLAPVLYHELGHHIAGVRGGSHTRDEDFADEWSRELTARFMRRKYWYAVSLMQLVGWLSKRARR
jgi:hypothetical protein